MGETDYLIKLIDGPAKGFEYHASISPDPEIAVAPILRDGNWTRVTLDGASWDGERVYVRQPEVFLEMGGTEIVEYRLKAEATFTLTVTYRSGGEQDHPGLDASAVEQGVGAFLSDLLHLQGEGITKLVVEIEAKDKTGVEQGDG